MASAVDRVAAAAQEVKPLRIVLSVLAFPFYVLGFVAALLWVAVLWVAAAAQVGFADARNRGTGES